MKTQTKTQQVEENLGYKMTELGILPEGWGVVMRFVKALKRYEYYLRWKYKVMEIGIFGYYEKKQGWDM